ncbi:MAG: ABC transporter permease [Sciscionella sp.]|nr:ABC transporter permease [Sciscionella sp.]
MRASFVFSEVITGLRRNVTMTIAMILTTAISLGLLGGGLLVVRLIDKMSEQYYSQAEVSVYLTDDSAQSCAKDPCASLRSSLENDSAVKNGGQVWYESQHDAYLRFQKIFAAQPELLKLTKESAIPAVLHVKLNDPTRSSALVSEYQKHAGVKDIDDQGEFLKRLFDALSGIRNAVFAIALVQALAALLLISNTIQISAFTRRTEVGIMRLVGASRWYTQLPFLLEAVVAGVIGAIVAIGGLIAAKSAFIDKVLASPIKSGIVPQLGLGDVAFVSPWLLLAAIVISAVTGYVTLRMYVRL